MASLVLALGVLFTLAGVTVAIVGGAVAVFVPHLIVIGLLLLVGLAIERWRYKPILQQPPEPHWTDTGERFIDPETGQLTAVYTDAQGERHYLAIQR